ncbi:MAG: glutaredoxin family protein [Mycobacteriales bacterium]
MRLRRRRPQLLTFVTRTGCALCEEALPIVQRLAADAGVPVELRDVDADAGDRARWSDHVPVVLLEGRPLSYWFVDPQALRRALRGRPSAWVEEVGPPLGHTRRDRTPERRRGGL